MVGIVDLDEDPTFSSGARFFVELLDTPNDYIGAANFKVVVNGSGSALIFVEDFPDFDADSLIDYNSSDGIQLTAANNTDINLVTSGSGEFKLNGSTVTHFSDSSLINYSSSAGIELASALDQNFNIVLSGLGEFQVNGVEFTGFDPSLDQDITGEWTFEVSSGEKFSVGSNAFFQVDDGVFVANTRHVEQQALHTGSLARSRMLASVTDASVALTANNALLTLADDISSGIVTASLLSGFNGITVTDHDDNSVENTLIKHNATVGDNPQILLDALNNVINIGGQSTNYISIDLDGGSTNFSGDVISTINSGQKLQVLDDAANALLLIDDGITVAAQKTITLKTVGDVSGNASLILLSNPTDNLSTVRLETTSGHGIVMTLNDTSHTFRIREGGLNYLDIDYNTGQLDLKTFTNADLNLTANENGDINLNTSGTGQLLVNGSPIGGFDPTADQTITGEYTFEFGNPSADMLLATDDPTFAAFTVLQGIFDHTAVVSPSGNRWATFLLPTGGGNSTLDFNAFDDGSSNGNIVAGNNNITMTTDSTGGNNVVDIMANSTGVTFTETVTTQTMVFEVNATEYLKIDQAANTVELTQGAPTTDDGAATKKYVDDLRTRTVAGTTDTILVSDNGGVVYFTSNSPITLDFDTDLPANFSVTVIQAGTGLITFAGTATLNNVDSHTQTRGQHSVVSFLSVVNDFLTFSGATQA